MNITIKSSWDEITWKEYEQIEQIIGADVPADYKAVHLIAILTGKTVDEIEDLPISQFKQLVSNIEFLYTEPKHRLHKMEYTINGRDYVFKGVVNEITTAQYIDYRTYIQEDTIDVVKMFSCFLIPKGHEYNDGYDINQVMSDINDMCWLDVRAASFFFKIQYAAYILILKSSLLRTMKETKATKEQRKQVAQHLDNMVSCLLYSKSANTQIPTLIL